MRIPIYQIDAFTSELFRGNPAAVSGARRADAPSRMTATDTPVGTDRRSWYGLALAREKTKENR